MRHAAAIAIELVILGAAHLAGGPEWAAVAAVACVAHAVVGLGVAPLASAAPALAWLAAARLTGNRELFFPYAMLLATSILPAAPPGGRSRGIIAAAAVVAAFLAVRVMQRAPGGVLAVEFVAAAAVLAAAAAVPRFVPAAAGRWWLPTAASLLAAACLLP